MANINRIIKKVIPSVVSIYISKTLEEVERELPAELAPMMPNHSSSEFKVPKDKIDAHGMVLVGGGSGFIVSQNGIILTNKHVVSDAEAEYTVITNDNKKYKAAIIARDPIDDVAILKIDAFKLTIAKLGNSSKVELGDDVLAIGNALGLFRNTVSKGIISGLSRSISAKPDPKEPVQELRGLIQTDASINQGNSGGPLINMNGEVIGINAAIVYGAENIGFALPINSARRDLEDIKKYGHVSRPLLGLRYLTIDENLQEKMKLPVSYGALVSSHGSHQQAIIPNTPAHLAGFKEKDIILECNGQRLTVEKTIQDFLENLNVGDVLQTKVLRGGKEMDIKATLAERK